ncbi:MULTISPECIES: hypothetical protein [Streptomyces]|uniref:Secreted protein n=1 Tax=Streptomyces clavifer TaxID=68188 RepID=A0ABS4V3H6_9ACTN|nr:MULTISPECIES: hypothetical protein [Streptomyces]MBP2358431.1 hypothetical protein [Streptomyces clavifer]MDX2746867.1 hypothetical protein [Streptomyces sp. NRRL_B-2557]GHB19347.1 hypothetical protein GCM10010392_54790 [Streptomyces clavifer]
MIHVHRASCLAFGALVLAGAALGAFAVPAQAAEVRVSATHTTPCPPQPPARPEVPRPGHDPHDFGWQ